MIADGDLAMEVLAGRAEDQNNRGGDLIRQGKIVEAIDCYREALRLRPAYVEAHNNLGNALARRGRLEEAIASYREALRLRPGYSKALCNLGNALCGAGRLDEAEAAHRDAVRAEPGWAEAHNDLGITLTRRGKLGEAEDRFGEALRLLPGYVEAMNNLGIALARGGRLEAAEAAYRQALRLRPGYPEAHHNLGHVLARRGRQEDAVRCYGEAIRLSPGYAQAHHALANTLARMGRHGEAEASYQEALRLRPDDPDVLNDRAISLSDQGRYEEAAAVYRAALKVRPGFVEVHNNLGNALRQAGRLEESLASYGEALRLRPDYAEAHNNLGIALRTLGRHDEAAECYTRALRLRPGYVDAHVNRSMAWLRAGRFELGWPEYEWRWKKPEAAPPTFVQPPWNGAPLGGRAVLLHTEQGSGDTLQFIRYALLVRARGGRVFVSCPGPMIPLLSRCCGIDRLVPKGAPLPEFDLHAGLMSLPGIFHTELASIPADVPYLYADEELAGDWRRRLAAVPGFKVGVVWQGNPKFPSDQTRSFPLWALAPLAAVPGVSLVSLQVAHGTDQLRGVDFPVLDLGDELTRAPGMFMDAAAAVRNLDLVLACDTALAHLAGGLGAPVWVALPYSPDWRWLVGRADSPWYPTMRLFRQPSFDDWGTVFRRMAGALEERLSSPPSLRPGPSS
jgi:Flp pilus assembly protein TadD